MAVFITLKGFRSCLKCQCGGGQGNFNCSLIGMLGTGRGLQSHGVNSVRAIKSQCARKLSLPMIEGMR